MATISCFVNVSTLATMVIIVIRTVAVMVLITPNNDDHANNII